MNTKRLFATILSLALTLALTFMLTACGDGDSGSTSTPDTASPPQDATTPDTGIDDNTPNAGGNDSTSSGNIGTIPDNGTPPSVPSPFETHAGDVGYFFVDTDDYAVFKYDVSQNSRNKAYDYGSCEYYLVISFDDTDYTTRLEKWVFENVDDANSFASSEGKIAIDNVVYNNYDPSMQAEAFQGVGKGYHINNNYKPAVWAYGGSAYLSVPAGFEELLADDGLKGKNGSMTLREALYDAGFTDLPEMDGLDYDAVTNFFLLIDRDEVFQADETSIFIFDGETQVDGYRFFFYEDKETSANEYGPFDNSRTVALENMMGHRINGKIVYVSE